MPDSAELLILARRLSQGYESAPPTDAELRRAVSTAYYALFHKVLRAAAARFMGRGQEGTAGFAILYRGFNHGLMKRVCEDLQGSTLKEKYQVRLKRTALSQDIRDFAATFPTLQELRHLADYDPSVQFLPSEVSDLVDAAAVAIDAFERAAPDEQADVLALLMVGIRD
jgi:hypothetical protein